jgi:hypothetical protein
MVTIRVMVRATWSSANGVARPCLIGTNLDELIRAAPDELIHISSQGIATSVPKQQLSAFAAEVTAA